MSNNRFAREEKRNFPEGEDKCMCLDHHHTMAWIQTKIQRWNFYENVRRSEYVKTRHWEQWKYSTTWRRKRCDPYVTAERWKRNQTLPEETKIWSSRNSRYFRFEYAAFLKKKSQGLIRIQSACDTRRKKADVAAIAERKTRCGGGHRKRQAAFHAMEGSTGSCKELEESIKTLNERAGILNIYKPGERRWRPMMWSVRSKLLGTKISHTEHDPVAAGVPAGLHRKEQQGVPNNMGMVFQNLSLYHAAGVLTDTGLISGDRCWSNGYQQCDWRMLCERHLNDSMGCRADTSHGTVQYEWTEKNFTNMQELWRNGKVKSLGNIYPQSSSLLWDFLCGVAK